jgi:hypothetical protein
MAILKKKKLTAGLKIFYLPTLTLKSPKKCSCGTCTIDQTHAVVPLKSCLLYHHPYLQLWHVLSDNNNTQLLSIACNILLLPNSNFWSGNMIVLWIKNFVINLGLSFPFHQKMCDCLLVQSNPFPIWPPALPLNLTHTSLILSLLFSLNWHTETLNIPSSKCHIHFPSLRSFQRTYLKSKALFKIS